jgi:Mg-chelatase subunit ChlD
MVRQPEAPSSVDATNQVARVYDLANADPQEVQQILQDLFQRSGNIRANNNNNRNSMLGAGKPVVQGGTQNLPSSSGTSSGPGNNLARGRFAAAMPGGLGGGTDGNGGRPLAQPRSMAGLGGVGVRSASGPEASGLYRPGLDAAAVPPGGPTPGSAGSWLLSDGGVLLVPPGGPIPASPVAAPTGEASAIPLQGTPRDVAPSQPAAGTARPQDDGISILGDKPTVAWPFRNEIERSAAAGSLTAKNAKNAEKREKEAAQSAAEVVELKPLELSFDSSGSDSKAEGLPAQNGPAAGVNMRGVPTTQRPGQGVVYDLGVAGQTNVPLAVYLARGQPVDKPAPYPISTTIADAYFSIDPESCRVVTLTNEGAVISLIVSNIDRQRATNVGKAPAAAAAPLTYARAEPSAANAFGMSPPSRLGSAGGTNVNALGQPSHQDTGVREAVYRQASRLSLGNVLARAHDAQERGDLVVAAKLYDDAWGLAQSIGSGVDQEVQQTKGGLAAARLPLARSAQHRGNLREARVQVEDVLRADPANPAAIELRQEIDKLLAEPKNEVPSEKVERMVPAVVASKSRAAQLVQDGKLLYEMGKLDEAERKLKDARKEDPENDGAYYYLNRVSKARLHTAIKERDLASREKLGADIEKKWATDTQRKLRELKESEKLARGGIEAQDGARKGAEQQLAQAHAQAERLSQPRLATVPAASQVEPDQPVTRQLAASAPIPQPEVQARENAFSTFSLNVSDVSFKLAAASLEKGLMPEPATVRSEEFINAFDYRDPEAPAGVPVAFACERARYPFAHNRDLLRFSLKTAAQGRQAGRPLNVVLLLDNSGSMERADRVRIIHEALRVLAGQLEAQDKLSVVTFARTARLWVDGVPGSQAGQVAEAVSGLTPQGGTNLEEAMNLAYQTALRHYLANGINRVVLLTDGAANLGNVEPEALKQKVEAHRKQGIALDCFGIGWEGYNDDLLEVLSRNGDGRYGFLNTPEEAAGEFAGQLAGALRVAASDVKVQVEFNPARVRAYRQLGYARHQLAKEQFRDNTVNAAQIGAAESGNALYVIETDPRGDGPLGVVRVRYRVPGTSEYREQEWTAPYTGSAAPLEQSSAALRLAAVAGAFSEWLVSSPFAGEVTTDRLLGYLRGVPEVYGPDARPGKLEWMIRQAQSLGGK